MSVWSLGLLLPRDGSLNKKCTEVDEEVVRTMKIV